MLGGGGVGGDLEIRTKVTRGWRNREKERLGSIEEPEKERAEVEKNKDTSEGRRELRLWPEVGG